MNAANGPIDFLRNTESVKVSQSQRRDIDGDSRRDSNVSSSKTREKSFGDVYRQQRREDAQVRQNNQADRRHDHQNRVDARQQQAHVARSDGVDKRVDNESSIADNGKGLPHQPRLSSEDVSSRTKKYDNDALAADSDNETGVANLNQEVEVTVTFDTPELAAQELSEQKLGQQELGQQEAFEKNADLIALEATGFSFGEESDVTRGEQTVVSFDRSLLTDADVEDDVDSPELSLAVQDEKDSEKAEEQKVKTAADDAVVLQVQQTAPEQQAKELKQSTLADVVESRGKNEVNVPSITKASTTGVEQSVQLQDRLAAVATGQEFKLLREQLSDANAVTGKEGAIDASTSSDSSADRLPRLNALSQAAQMMGAARPSTVTASVQTPVNSPDWGQAMSQRIMWLVNRGISAAELQLNPSGLGPVDVRINVNGEQTTVQFISPQPAVREALESSVVKLREMMESSGLDLVDVNVSDQSHSEQAQSDSRGSSGSASGDNNHIEGGAEAQVAQRIESDGLVDFYA